MRIHWLDSNYSLTCSGNKCIQINFKFCFEFALQVQDSSCGNGIHVQLDQKMKIKQADYPFGKMLVCIHLLQHPWRKWIYTRCMDWSLGLVQDFFWASQFFENTSQTSFKENINTTYEADLPMHRNCGYLHNYSFGLAGKGWQYFLDFQP